ncbi:MAG: nucleotidyltransferase domain-containing protein [Syntrophales bacterium]|jgi:predicted nucleotidyltransferase|nr:nucleotidyltransferase domain-containing protein [Syntrophales bacterium]MCK9528592.1 nucleotidyltransferase domain-containing protein [Syntrophales bacterium]MDX9922771.1 nucleotidyltransferase domain-containing protein [Syntrophales bacterium]
MQSFENSAKAQVERHDDIVLAFLFGSAAAGRETPASDLDIALLFREAPSRERVEAIRQALEQATGREIDLVLLNDASPIIRMQVLKKGIPLIRRGRAYEAFFTRTVNEYEDLKYQRREIEKNIHRGRIHA